MAHTPKPIPKHTAGPYKIRRGEIWAVGDPLDREECLGTVYRAEGWTEGEPIRTEAQANAAFIARAMECHDDLLAACKAQHEAIDILFAMLIARSPAGGTFYPSKSGQPWEAMKAGHAAIAKAGAS